MKEHLMSLQRVSVESRRDEQCGRAQCWHNSRAYEERDPQRYLQVSGWLRSSAWDPDAWIPHFWVKDLASNTYFDPTPIDPEAVSLYQYQYYLDPEIRILGNRLGGYGGRVFPEAMIKFEGDDYYSACWNQSCVKERSTPTADNESLRSAWRHSVRLIQWLDDLESSDTPPMPVNSSLSIRG